MRVLPLRYIEPAAFVIVEYLRQIPTGEKAEEFFNFQPQADGSVSFKHTVRIAFVGETLFVLRNQPGFSEFCRRFKNRDFRSTMFDPSSTVGAGRRLRALQRRVVPGTADSGATPAPGLAPISADTLYQNGLRDLTGGKYDLARQEFSDYIKNFPSNDLASNATFYIGEIAYAQNDFKGAIASYNKVLVNYPKSFKADASLLKKGMAELELGLKASGIRDLRELVLRSPTSDEGKRAQAKLRELGVAPTARPDPLDFD